MMESPPHPVIPSSRPPAPATAPLRAWVELVWLSMRRQARLGQMVGIALGVLVLALLYVALIHYRFGWSLGNRRAPNFRGLSYRDVLAVYTGFSRGPIQQAASAAASAVIATSDFRIFSRGIIFTIFLSFLMPLWSLSFATQALGGDRENRVMVWLLTRPLPRSAVYLAKFVALLPWVLGLNLGGFALLCLVAGEPGRLALQLYWPAVLMGTLAFAALFHLIGAWFRRPAVVGLVYAFFLETVAGDLPGLLKRASISFYTRCLMFDAAGGLGVGPDQPTVYAPVDGPTAWWVLAFITVALTAVGMALFARMEYGEDV